MEETTKVTQAIDKETIEEAIKFILEEGKEQGYQEAMKIIEKLVKSDYRCLVDIQNGCVIRGSLPARQLKLVLAWNELHTDELMQNWELAKDDKPLNAVAPLM